MVVSIVDRIVNVELVCLCPHMDIVALVTRDGALVVNRTTSWQRLMAPAEAATGAISALCWSPDGRRLAAGHWQGALSVYDVEAGALAYSGACRDEGIEHKHRISLTWWTKQVCATAHSSNRSIHGSKTMELMVGASVHEHDSDLSMNHTV